MRTGWILFAAALLTTESFAQTARTSAPQMLPAGQTYTPPPNYGQQFPAAQPTTDSNLYWRYVNEQSPQPVAAPPIQPARNRPTATPVSGGARRQDPAPQPKSLSSPKMTGPNSPLEFDLTEYTSKFSPSDRPEDSVRRWLLKETGDVWHGAELAYLSVTAERVKVYHHPEVQAKVGTMLGRFIHFTPGLFKVRARAILSRDGSWRTDVLSRLESINVDKGGREAWKVPPGMAEAVVQALTAGVGSTILADTRFDAPNGQRTVFELRQPHNYVRRLTPASEGNRPEMAKVDEGFTLQFWPLIADGASVDVDFDLAATRIKETTTVSLDLPGEPNSVEVPEVAESSVAGIGRLRIGQSLLVSLGRGPSFDTRPSVLKPRHPETVVLLEILPEQNSMVAGAAIVVPQVAPIQLTGGVQPAGGAFSSTATKPVITSKRKVEGERMMDLGRPPF